MVAIVERADLRRVREHDAQPEGFDPLQRFAKAACGDWLGDEAFYVRAVARADRRFIVCIRQHDHRKVGGAGLVADGFEHLEAADPGQAGIEEDEIGKGLSGIA